jgi:peptidoglycan/xylan/chitin deacetylase (PgdA/CDA1 family)
MRRRSGRTCTPPPIPALARCVASIRRVASLRPLGWHARSYPSVNTRRLLVEEGGFLYDVNTYNDDLPYTVDVARRHHVVLPYSFDTNDMRDFNGRGFSHAEDFARYCIDAFDWLHEEEATAPRMMTVGLHTRIIGRPVATRTPSEKSLPCPFSSVVPMS